jgi:hypothetical protein
MLDVAVALVSLKCPRIVAFTWMRSITRRKMCAATGTVHPANAIATDRRR